MAEVVCSVCGKPIAENDSRVVDVDTATKAKIHVHLTCKKARLSVSCPPLPPCHPYGVVAVAAGRMPSCLASDGTRGSVTDSPDRPV
jgi:hypothetical protein